MYGRRETGDKEADGRTTLAYTWPCKHRPRKPIARQQSAPLPLTQVPTHSCVSARKQTSQKWESFRHVVCMPVCGVRRTAASRALGRVASCLILTAYPPAVYVPLDLQYTCSTRLRQRKPVSAQRAAVLLLPASTHRSKCAHILRLLDDSPDLGASISDRAVFKLPYSL